MSNQVFPSRIPLLTGLAHKGPLTSVHTHVSDKPVLFTEGFLAESADVKHFTGTHFHLSRPVSVSLTRQAGMKLVSTQDFLVGIEKTPFVART